MKNLITGLTSKGAHVIGTAPAHHDWRLNNDVIKKIRSADIVVVNGEGSLHHDCKKGASLLEVGKYAREIGIKSALINFSWFNNSDVMVKKLADFDVISARESFSWEQVRKFRSDSFLVPDLSMAGQRPPSRERSGLGVGDSVDFTVTTELLGFLNEIPSRYTSIIYPGNRAFGRPRLLFSVLRDVWLHRDDRRRARIEWGLRNTFQSAGDERAFLMELSKLEALITGRFHGVALSVVAGTPFLAIRSNTPKIEALLRDIGISEKRIVTLREFTIDRLRDIPSMKYSSEEHNNINSFIESAGQKATRLFEAIRGLIK